MQNLSELVSSRRRFLLTAGCLAFGAVSGVSVFAQEKDKRLQSDGKGWRLDQAQVTDASRPRVLLIGDSILNGYLGEVKKALAGKAYVDAWVNPYCQSSYKLTDMLTEVLTHGPYDVIHFNMGLHGWQKGRIKEGQFEPLTRKYVEVLKAKAPKAALIWANTTPVTVKGKPGELDTEINSVILQHNAMADHVMQDMHVPVNDFYSLLSNKLELARGDQFHWKPEAYKILAQAVATKVIDALAHHKR